MTPEQFAYWLQGFAEISQKAPSEAEWTVIKDHLATVFNKVTPNRITSPGPSVFPNDPTKPDPITGPYNPYPIPWTHPGTRPEIMCTTQDTTWKPTDGAYCFTMNSTQERNIKFNEKNK